MAEDFPPAQTFFPGRPTLARLRRAVQDCRACPLYRDATRAVFGEGADGSRLVLVGEQPGDSEDRQGRPFVGSSGRLLDEILDEVGLPREELYVTNAVKHFRFERRGKRRIHEKPGLTEVRACLPWFEAEVERVRPRMIVCLGATAARAVLGPRVRITKDRGKVFPSELAPWVMPTFHPSAALRSPRQVRERTRIALREDLAAAADHYRQL